MAPRRRSELYRLGVGAVALAIFVTTLGRLQAGGLEWWLVASLSATGLLALEFPLHISLSVKVSVASAVFFAAVLLLPVAQAAALVGALQALDISVAAVRKIRRTRERPPVHAVAINLLFNGGQAYLSALLGGLLLQFAGVSARTGLADAEGALALVAAAVVMYGVNIFLVSLAVALATSRSPFPLFLNTQRLVYVILRPLSDYHKVLDLVLTHHERYDGRGYPNGTVGRRLLLIAQVIPVADSLDAMTTARAYRGPKPWASAMEELRRGAGTQWNPQVVEAAVAVLSQVQPAPAAVSTAAVASA